MNWGYSVYYDKTKTRLWLGCCRWKILAGLYKRCWLRGVTYTIPKKEYWIFGNIRVLFGENSLQLWYVRLPTSAVNIRRVIHFCTCYFIFACTKSYIILAIWTLCTCTYVVHATAQARAIKQHGPSFSISIVLHWICLVWFVRIAILESDYFVYLVSLKTLLGHYFTKRLVKYYMLIHNDGICCLIALACRMYIPCKIQKNWCTVTMTNNV